MRSFSQDANLHSMKSIRKEVERIAESGTMNDKEQEIYDAFVKMYNIANRLDTELQSANGWIHNQIKKNTTA